MKKLLLTTVLFCGLFGFVLSGCAHHGKHRGCGACCASCYHCSGCGKCDKGECAKYKDLKEGKGCPYKKHHCGACGEGKECPHKEKKEKATES